MSGESSRAKAVITGILAEADASASMDRDAMGRALIQAVVEQYRTYRSAKDIAQELAYLAESLDDDDPVVTRGC